MVGEPTTFTREWFDAFGDGVQDATPLLAEARALKTEQEVERMRLANEIAAAAMEHCRLILEPGMTEAQIAAEWEGFVHGEGTGWEDKVELALGFSLVWSGPGIKTFTATTSRPVVEGEPTLFEIWVCADGYWCDHTKNLVAGELTPRSTASWSSGSWRVYDDAIAFARPGASLAELDRRVRAGIAAMGFPGQPSHPICHGVGARAHEPPYAHQAGGGDDRGRHGACNRARMLYRGRRRAPRRGQLPDHRRRRGEALALPGWDSPGVTLDRSKLWTGDLNAKALEPQPRVTVGLYDTTLRDGEQTVGVVLSPEDKLEIARALDAAGVDRIEAGFPRVSEDDAQRDLADPRGRARRGDLGLLARRARGRRGARRARPARLRVESPISDGKLAALGVSREAMLERIRSAVSFAVAQGIRVAFFGVDSSRAELEFVRAAYETAVEAGAAEVVVVDTLGIATPEAAAFLVEEVAERLGHEVPVHWHGHDDFGLATAAAVAAVQAGATWVHGTVNGMGERAGNADLVEVALALEALYGIPTRLRLDKARELARLVQEPAGNAARRPGSP